jgi:Predicted protease with the C-terminal PDZ domain
MKMTGDDLLVPVDIDETIYGNNESVTGYLSTDEFDLPLILRVGISDDIMIGKSNRITWAVDSNSPNDNKSYINTGIELGLMNDLLVLRSGVNSLLLDNREREFSYGVGIRSPSFMKQELYINYCFEVLEHLGDTHQISMGISY